MGQIVVTARCNIKGWHVKGVGTFDKGSTWSIDTLPLEVFKKATDTAFDEKGRTIQALSFMTPTGSFIPLAEAYIPRFKHGKPPAEAFIVESPSRKVRDEDSDTESNEETENEETDLNTKDENVSEDSEEVSDENSSKVSEETSKSSKKSKKKKNKEV